MTTLTTQGLVEAILRTPEARGWKSLRVTGSSMGQFVEIGEFFWKLGMDYTVTPYKARRYDIHMAWTPEQYRRLVAIHLHTTKETR